MEQFESLTIHKAREFHTFLLDELKSNDILRLDMKNVNAIDASCVQLLIACKKSCNEQNKSLQLLNISDELVDVFSILGADLFLEV